MARPFFLIFILSLGGIAQVFGADFSPNPIQQWVQDMAHFNVTYLLLVLGFYALVFEFSAPGVGVGGILGVLCMVLAFFSLQGPPMNAAGITPLLLAIVAPSAIFLGVVVRKIWDVRRKKPVTGAEVLVGQMAEVRSEGMVFVDGALWTAEGNLAGMTPGDRVRVVKISGNRLIVQKEE